MTTERAVPSRSVASVTDLVERPDGLWEYHGETLQDHIAVWRDIDGKVNSAQWAMAAIAASLTIKHGQGEKGESNIEEFSKAVNRSPGYIWKMARTWIFWSNRSDCPQGHFEDLTFSHHVRAITHGDPVEAMHVAVSRGLSAIGLEEWITEQAKDKASKPKPKTKEPPRKSQEYRDWLEDLDNALLKQYIPTCPSQKFAQRVMSREWREQIAWELRNLNQEDNREMVLDAIEDGALTEDDIKKVTHLGAADVRVVVTCIVDEGLYEWVREGGETDMARGSRRSILHKVGTPVFTR